MGPSAHIIAHQSRHNFLIARKIFEIDVLRYFEQMFWVVDVANKLITLYYENFLGSLKLWVFPFY